MPEMPYSPDPDVRLQELAETEARIKQEIQERQQVLADITQRKLKIQQMLATANKDGPAPKEMTPGWPGWKGPVGPVARDANPETGRVVEYFDDPNKMSPALRQGVQEYVNRPMAPAARPAPVPVPDPRYDRYSLD